MAPSDSMKDWQLEVLNEALLITDPPNLSVCTRIAIAAVHVADLDPMSDSTRAATIASARIRKKIANSIYPYTYVREWLEARALRPSTKELQEYRNAWIRDMIRQIEETGPY